VGSSLIDLDNNTSDVENMSDEVFKNRLEYSLMIRKLAREMTKNELCIGGWEELIRSKNNL